METTNNFEKSANITNLAKALIAFRKEVKDIKKDADNPYFKSKYAPLDAILPEIKEPLEKCGLTFTQLPVGESELITILIHAESGEFLQAKYSMTPSKKDPQGQGSAITYMRRYALVSILGLNTEEDDDGNEASQPTGKPSTTKKTTEPVDLNKPPF